MIVHAAGDRTLGELLVGVAMFCVGVVFFLVGLKPDTRIGL
jgi:hypothetical protein